jgi:hypothetical protein
MGGQISPVLQFVAVMHPGEDCRLEAEATPENWAKVAKIVIEWTRSPTRLGKREHVKIPLAQIVSYPPDPEP